MFLHTQSIPTELCGYDLKRNKEWGERQSAPSRHFLSLAIAELVSFHPTPSLLHAKRRTARPSRYRDCAFGPTVLDVAGVGGEGVEAGGGCGQHPLLRPSFIFRSSTAIRYSLGLSCQNTFCDAARKPIVVAVCHVVPEPRGSLFRLARPCLAMFVGRQPRILSAPPVFPLVTGLFLQTSSVPRAQSLGSRDSFTSDFVISSIRHPPF
jgi:hypothetical protein